MGIVWPSSKTQGVNASGGLNKPEADDDRKVEKKESLRNSIVIRTKWTENQNAANPEPNANLHWEDQPIKTKGDPFKGGENDPFSNANEQPSVNKSTVNESMAVVQPPKFGLNDFEAMIEKAMQEAGEKP